MTVSTLNVWYCIASIRLKTLHYLLCTWILLLGECIRVPSGDLHFGERERERGRLKMIAVVVLCRRSLFVDLYERYSARKFIDFHRVHLARQTKQSRVELIADDWVNWPETPNMRFDEGENDTEKKSSNRDIFIYLRFFFVSANDWARTSHSLVEAWFNWIYLFSPSAPLFRSPTFVNDEDRRARREKMKIVYLSFGGTQRMFTWMLGLANTALATYLYHSLVRKQQQTSSNSILYMLDMRKVKENSWIVKKKRKNHFGKCQHISGAPAIIVWLYVVWRLRNFRHAQAYSLP